MNDRTKGALEALAFARSVTSGKARREIQEAIDLTIDQVAKDYKLLIKYM